MTDGVVLDAEFLRNPFPTYAILRENAPVTRARLPSGLGVWLVTRYDDARAVLAEPSLSRDVRAAQDVIERHMDRQRPRREVIESVTANMLNTDPPDHTRLRRLIGTAFTSRRIASLRPRIVRIADELLEPLHRRGHGDLIAEFATPLPVTVICELLGVPGTDVEEFRAWTDTLLQDRCSSAEIEAASQALGHYLTRLIAAQRSKPGEDLLAALIQARDAADSLSENELLAMAFLLLVAGHETTVNLIGNGTVALLRHPAQWAMLRAEPTLVPTAVEEMLRYDGPVNTALLRFSTEPVTIGGVSIPADEVVVVSLASANRDPRRFDRPDVMDVSRAPGGHIAFGHGIHHCLGAPLARLEGEVAFTAMLRWLPGLRLAVPSSELRWRSSVLLRGLVELPVEVVT